jgi:outer membrane protein insertion porin family
MDMKYSIWIIGLLILASSCSIQKHLPKDTYLYNGADINITKTPDNKTKSKPIKSYLKSATFPKKNKMILGFPYKLAFWYTLGAPKKQGGFKFWLLKQFGEPPVLSNKIDLEANANNMKAYLENKGYFKSAISDSTRVKGYKMTAVYDVLLTKPYIIDSVAWVLDSSKLSHDISTRKKRRTFVKKDQQFDLENIKAEGKRIDIALKRIGYYYFSPTYIKTYVDTTNGGNKANLFFSVKKDIPLDATLPQTINAIVIFPNYTLVDPPPDTSKHGMFEYDGVFIRDTVKAFRPYSIVRSINYRSGSLYNVEKHNESLNRLINLGAFKFVKNRYEQVGDSTDPSKMNVYYYLTPQKKKTISAELGGFSKSNSFTGAQVNLNWRNRNLFRGAEQLNVKTFGAFEVSSNDSLSKNNNFRVGAELSLTIPRIIVPYRTKGTRSFLPSTKFAFGYEWQRRQLLYTNNFLRFQYTLNWKKKTNIEHSFSPFSLTVNNTSKLSEEYLEIVNQYPVLQYANKPEMIMGMFYNYVYTSKNPGAKNIYYFVGNIDVAGNISGLIRKPDSVFSKKIGRAYFAQYGKVDFDFRYMRKFGENTYLANRIFVGVGLPYGNSGYLPFSRQYIIGGGASLRGFPPRQLGPGSVKTTADQQISYPQIGGDFKLELQTELRFPLVAKLRGAVFAETGNIWTRTAMLYGPEGMLTKQFLNQLAVDAGVGLRLDVKIFILRLDVAIPLRKPWLPAGSEWLTNFDFGSSSWRKENLVFNLGFGYPF